MTAPSCPVGASTCLKGILVQMWGEHSPQHKAAAWHLSLYPCCAPKQRQCWLLQPPCSSQGLAGHWCVRAAASASVDAPYRSPEPLRRGDGGGGGWLLPFSCI